MTAAALPWIMAAVSVAGTAYSAYSSERAGDKAKEAEKRSAAMQAMRYAEQEKLQREKARRLLATQAARVGASGVTLEGSPILNLMQTQEQYEKELANIRLGTQWEISETLRRGKAYDEAGEVRAGRTILSGLGELANLEMRYGWLSGNKPTTGWSI